MDRREFLKRLSIAAIAGLAAGAGLSACKPRDQAQSGTNDPTPRKPSQ